MPPFWQGLNSLPAFERQHEIALRDFQLRLERPGVLDLVDVDLRGAAHRFDVLRFVIEVIPSFRIVQAPDHVDAVGRNPELAVVEIVLVRGEDMHRRTGLLPRVDRRLLRRDRAPP